MGKEKKKGCLDSLVEMNGKQDLCRIILIYDALSIKGIIWKRYEYSQMLLPSQPQICSYLKGCFVFFLNYMKILLNMSTF